MGAYESWVRNSVRGHQVALGTKPIGNRVLVLEDESYFMDVSVAQKLAGEGHEVTLVTPLSEIAGYLARCGLLS